MTMINLTRCLTHNLTSRVPKKHLQEEHNTKLTRGILEQNNEILDKCTDHRRLSILKSLYIKELNPTLNKQVDDLRTIPTMRK